MTCRPAPLVITLADDRDRLAIYAIRHDVYAKELRQHALNADRLLRDKLDDVNTYIVVRDGQSVVGFVAVTPPNPLGYSIDKYFDRAATGLTFDNGLYEVRLLTVVDAYRRTQVAALLMYAALRYIKSCGARTIAAIGRQELLGLYERVGLERRGLYAQAGAVTYELMSAAVHDLLTPRWASLIRRLEQNVDWLLPKAPVREPACYHGGAAWDRFGDQFDRLEQRGSIITADVLDAWFEPAPSILQRLSEDLPFVLRTSPPTHAEGLVRMIADARGIPQSAVMPGAGSSALIFTALQHWVRPWMRVLILDPMYGEYAHVLERVIGASVERLALRREQQFDVDIAELTKRLRDGYDWIVLVNPNSPTGRHVSRERLINALEVRDPRTRVWIDETYVDYVGPAESLENYAARSPNIIVCKSMSKVYALSGVRVAYLVGPHALITELRPLCPPWAVSLAAQVAACEALRATEYYVSRWKETHELREELRHSLEALGWDVTPGCANFLLCHLPASVPLASDFVELARAQDIFIRNTESMGSDIGNGAVRIAVKDRRTNARMLRGFAGIAATFRKDGDIGAL